MTPDRGDADTRQSEYLAKIQKIVEEHNGTVSQVVKNGLTATFGLDSISEKHALHACIAARKIRDAMDGLEMRAGIHTGDVFLEKNILHLGAMYRIEGETVHVARKLAKMSPPGAILISEDVRRLTAMRFHSHFHQLYLLANKRGYCSSYIMAGQKELSDPDYFGSPFGGREAELRKLLEGYRICKEGNPQAFFIHGNPGFGKTRLIGEFLKTACSTPGDLVIEHSFLPRTNAQQDLFQHLFNAALPYFCPQQPPLQTARFLEKMLGIKGSLAAESLYCLAGLGSANEQWHNLDAKTAESIMASVLCKMIRHLSELYPMILILEDIHWATDDLQTFLNQYQQTVVDTQSLLLISSRKDECDFPAARIELKPLSETAVETLLDKWIGTAQSLDSLKKEISGLSEGCPLFIYEIVTDLVNKGYLAGSHGAYVCAPDARKPPIPLTLQVLINAKIHSLDDTSYRVLKCASVIGARFNAGLVAPVAKMEADELARQLALLENQDLIVKINDGDPPAYQFRHALIHEETYRTILKPEKKILHERLFHALRKPDCRTIPDRIALLAHHAYAAELYAMGYAFHFRAASAALEKVRGDFALASFQCAVDCLSHLPKTARNERRFLLAQFGIFQALSIQGHHNKAKKILDEVSGQVAKAQPSADIAQKFGCLKLLNSWFAGNLEESLAFGRDLLETLDPEKDKDSYIPAAVRVAGVLVDIGHYREAIEVLKPIEDCFDFTRPPKRYGLLMTGSVSAFSYLARSYGELEEYEQAQKYAALALEQAEKGGSYLPLIFSLSHGSAYLIRKKKYAEALPQMERAFNLLKDVPTNLHYPLVASQLGFIYVHLGEPQKGLPLLHEAREVNLKQQSFRHALYVQLLAEAYLTLGDYANAIKYAEEAIAIADGHCEQADLARSCLIAARSHMMLDPQSDKILPFWERARALAERLDLKSLAPDLDGTGPVSSAVAA